MGVVWFVLRAEARQRWRSWLVLAVLVGVVSGFVLGAVAAGRRTAAAFPSFLRAYGYDSFVYGLKPLDNLTRLPEVTGAIALGGPPSGTPLCACRGRLNTSNFGVFETNPGDLRHVAKLVSGRLPALDHPYEVLASYTLQHDAGLRLGSVIRLPLAAPDQLQEVLAGNQSFVPRGPTVELHIVGFGAWESDFPSVGAPGYEAFTFPAFARAVNPRTIVFPAYAVRLRRGAADVARFERDATALGAVGFGAQAGGPSVASAIHPQAVGWWVLAALLALAGAAVVGQALNRQAMAERENTEVLTTLGLGRREVAVVGLVRAASIGLAGGLAAVSVAYALSPVAPLGEARIAEPSTSARFDTLVLGTGAVAVVLSVVLLGAWPAWRAGSRAGDGAAVPAARSSAVVGRLIRGGAPPSTVVGVRRALERGRGRAAVPVGNALGGAVLAVAALSGIAIFGASLTRLTATPRLYGQSFQVWMPNLGNGGANSTAVLPVVSELERDPAVTAVTLGISGAVTINGVGTDAIAGAPVRGGLLVPVVDGKVPVAPDEVALGHTTMRQVRASVGSRVRVTVPLPGGGQRTVNFRVVGTASFPPDFGVVGLDRGAVFTIDGLVAAQCRPGAGQPGCERTIRQSLYYVPLVAVKPGPVGQRAVARYVHEYPGAAIRPTTPANLVNFGQAVNFPLILGLVVTLFGAATVVHVLVVSVARRRRELALLKTLGFVRRQAVAAVAWQATTVAVVGLIVGVPIGIATGRGVWRAFALNIGVVPFAVIPIWGVAALAGGVLVAANVLAIGPALVSAGQRPGVALREE